MQMRGGKIFLMIAAAFLLSATPHSASANSSDTATYLRNVPACNPSLGGDCARTPRAEAQCTVDGDCMMGCVKNEPLEDQSPQCRPTANTSAACLSTLGNPLQTGVACGCLPDTHKCGYRPAPVK